MSERCNNGCKPTKWRTTKGKTMKSYTTKNDTNQVSVEQYPVDGFQLELSHWTGEEFEVLFNKRMIFYTLYEAVLQAFVETTDVDYWKAMEYADQMGIEPLFSDGDDD